MHDLRTNTTVGHTGIARLCLAQWCYRTRTKLAEIGKPPPLQVGGGRMSLIIVFLQFSIKFYFSGCLVLIINSKLMIFVGKRRGFPILTNCRFRIARKKKKIIHPRCGLGACLRCERAS